MGATCMLPVRKCRASTRFSTGRMPVAPYAHGMTGALEQRREAGGGEVLVVGEGFGQAEAAHDGEADAVDDAGVSGTAAFVLSPTFIPIVFRWNEQAVVGQQITAESNDVFSCRLTRNGIAALQQNKARGHRTTTRCEQFAKNSTSSVMPLVRLDPKSNQPHGVKKNWLHGCNSSTRAARSVSPVSYE